MSKIRDNSNSGALPVDFRASARRPFSLASWRGLPSRPDGPSSGHGGHAVCKGMPFFPCLTLVHLKLAALWQGELIAHWARLRRMWISWSPVPETNWRRSRRSSCGLAVRRLLHFSKSFLMRCPTDVSAGGYSWSVSARERGDMRAVGRRSP